MDNRKPTAYAYAPTKSGDKLPWALGQPDVRLLQVPVVPDLDSSGSDLGEEMRPVGALFERWRAARAEAVRVDPEAVRVDPEAPIDPIQPEAPRQEVRECTCGNCIKMPTNIENKCCQEEELDSTCVPDYERGKCLSECTDIKHNFNHVTVRHSWLNEQRFYGNTGPALLFGNMTNKNYRHHAYRTYINYIHELLGTRNRRVAPSCVVKVIRETWPDADGCYKG